MHAGLDGMGFDIHNERHIWLMHIVSFASCKIEQAKMHHDLEYNPCACSKYQPIQWITSYSNQQNSCWQVRFIWARWAGMMFMKTWYNMCKLWGGQWRCWGHRDAVQGGQLVLRCTKLSTIMWRTFHPHQSLMWRGFNVVQLKTLCVYFWFHCNKFLKSNILLRLRH